MTLAKLVNRAALIMSIVRVVRQGPGEQSTPPNLVQGKPVTTDFPSFTNKDNNMFVGVWYACALPPTRSYFEFCTIFKFLTSVLSNRESEVGAWHFDNVVDEFCVILSGFMAHRTMLRLMLKQAKRNC